MYKKFYVLTSLVAILLMLACASENEQGVLDAIAEVYNGDVSYSKSFTNNAKGKSTTFNVFIKNSKMADSLAPTVSTANAAVMVYDALTKEEREDYTHIQVLNINAVNDTVGYTYETPALAPASHKSKIFHEFSQRIVNKNFDGMDTLKSNTDIPKSISVDLKSGIANSEKKHGSVIKYTLFGIAEEKDNIGKVYQFQSHLFFEDGYKLRYLVAVDGREEHDKIVGYKFFNQEDSK